MSALPNLTHHLKSEDQTNAFGSRLARALGPGDLVTLTGPLGVGKSHLCRAIIRAVLNDPVAEVPSPSYTLVNTYNVGTPEIWHADLYRLGDASELTEIGLEDAVDHALVLIEWPDRWPDLPPRRLDLTLAFSDGDRRRVDVQPSGPGWNSVLSILEAST